MTDKRAKVAAYLLIVTVLAFALYIAGDVFCHRAAAAQEADKKIIAVSGEGIIKVKPDTAYIKVGVETRGTDAKKAQRDNARIMEEVTAKLKSFSIREDDIKTVTYSLYPVERYDDNTKRSYIYEYRVNNMVEVTVRDIDNTGAVIDGVSEVGSNKISSVRFAVEDTDALYKKALNAAVANADEKAEAIAKGIGVVLKGAVNVQEIGGGGPMVLRDEVSFMKALGAADMAATPIAAGETDISAMVSVQYAY